MLFQQLKDKRRIIKCDVLYVHNSLLKIKMEQRQLITTVESTSQSPLEIAVGLDPIVQTLDNQKSTPVYVHRRSSVFYIPATDIHKDNEQILNSNKKSNIFTKCFSYMERFSGIIYSLLSALCFSCTNFMLKQFNVILLDVFVIRLGIQALMALGFIIYKGYRPFSSNSHGLLTFIQSVIAGIGTVCLYSALLLLPLPEFVTIRHTQVVWTALIVFILFRERLTLPIILACILTFIGVIFIAQPSFLFIKTKTINETLSISSTANNKTRLFGILIALLCAVSLSISVLLNKRLIQKHVHQSIILFYFFLSAFAILLIIQIYYWVFSKLNQQKFDIKKNYLTKDFLFATIVATLQLIPMVFQQKAIKREHPSIVSVLIANEILFSIILQNIFSTNKSNLFTLIGSALVLTSIIILCVHKLWQDRYNRTLITTSVQENK